MYVVGIMGLNSFHISKSKITIILFLIDKQTQQKYNDNDIEI